MALAEGSTIGANHESKRCQPCCRTPGDILKPYPDCGCYFDGAKWDREHGK